MEVDAPIRLRRDRRRRRHRRSRRAGPTLGPRRREGPKKTSSSSLLTPIKTPPPIQPRAISTSIRHRASICQMMRLISSDRCAIVVKRTSSDGRYVRLEGPILRTLYRQYLDELMRLVRRGDDDDDDDVTISTCGHHHPRDDLVDSAWAASETLKSKRRRRLKCPTCQTRYDEKDLV